MMNYTSFIASVQYGDLLTSQQIAVVYFIYFKVLNPILEILGILANITNLIVFGRIGYRDPMAVSFAILSAVDLLYVIISSLIDFGRAWGTYVSKDLFDVTILGVVGYLTWYRYMLFDTSTCIESYIAVTRCCCVSMPIKFKNVFTARRSAWLCLAFLVLNVFAYLPLMSTIEMTGQWSAEKNKTILMAVFKETQDSFRAVNNLTNRTAFPVLALFTACVCASIMTWGLKRASEWRNISSHHANASVAPRSDDNNREKRATNKGRQFAATADRAKQGKQPSQKKARETRKYLSGKEMHVVKCVSVVTCKLAMTQLVISMFALAQVAEPEFMILHRYSNVYTLTSNLMTMVINAHVIMNLVIYYNFNSKFRDTLHQMVDLLCHTALVTPQAHLNPRRCCPVLLDFHTYLQCQLGKSISVHSVHGSSYLSYCCHAFLLSPHRSACL
ncbi:hypothetical protein Btru_058117 [Bulinus truncatus]|nr:hypothetical protein Btru_058117 [Bulinus truncatus]